MIRSATSFFVAIVALTLLAPETSAVIVMFLTDDFDDIGLVHSFREAKSVKEFGQKLAVLQTQLLRLKERDFEALFGKPARRSSDTFAMPVAQARGLGLSGVRYADSKMNKDHEEFYLIGTCAGLRVFYSIDGVSPAAVIFYLRVNYQFPRLTKNNLAKRLAWEGQRWQQLLDLFERRRARVFVWEVDREAEKQFFQGDYARDREARLHSWLESGKKLGLRVAVHKYADARVSGTHYRWYRSDGTLAREAERYPAATTFAWYHTDGVNRIRDDRIVDKQGGMTRWSRPKRGANLIRVESGQPSSWSWYDEKEKLARHEWDNNGDDIPDWFTTEEKGRQQPLAVEKSWAIHPDLIPAECRIPDQPERRLPVRKIAILPVTPLVSSVANVSTSHLQQSWEDLASADHRRAYRAVEQLAAVPARSIPFLAGKVKPDPKVDAGKVARLIQDLSSERFAEREKATREIEKWRWLASPALKKALATEMTLEGRLRLSSLLKKADAQYLTHLNRYSLAVKVLVLVDNADAHRLLDEWAGGAPEPCLSREARETLGWLIGNRR